MGSDMKGFGVREGLMDMENCIMIMEIITKETLGRARRMDKESLKRPMG